MEKEFVPYQQSLELKEIEFDEPCFGYYESTYGKDKVIIDNSGLITNTNFSKVFNETRFRLVSPTFSQAFRWFREKYKLVHEICENPKEMIDYVASKGERYLPTYSYGYSSSGHYCPISNTYIYEEAELGCLRKFIEIVKQKQ